MNTGRQQSFFWGGKREGEGFVAKRGALHQAVTATGSRGSRARDALTVGAFELTASQELCEIPRYFLLLVYAECC